MQLSRSKHFPLEKIKHGGGSNSADPVSEVHLSFPVSAV